MNKKFSRKFLLTLPYVIITLLFLIVPMLMIVIFSFLPVNGFSIIDNWNYVNTFVWENNYH